jgi:hypothetical protein
MLRKCPLPNIELTCLCFAKYITQIGGDDLGETLLTHLIGMSIPGAYKNFYAVWEIAKRFVGDWTRTTLLTEFVARMAKSSQSPLELTKRYLQIERRQFRISSDLPTWWTLVMQSSIHALYDIHESRLMDIIECVLPRSLAGTPSLRRGIKRPADCVVLPMPKRICFTYYDDQPRSFAPKKRARAMHDTSSTKRPCLSTAKCVMCSTGIPSGQSTCSSQCDRDFVVVYE